MSLSTELSSTESDPEVLELIDRAEEHPLGTDFLVNGCLESVAATFGVHAFVVDKARESFPPPPPVDVGLTPDEGLREG